MSRVWAVARHTVAAGVRMKVVLFFLIVIGAAVLGLPFVIQGDGSLVGAIQSYLMYSLILVSLFLSLQTIFMSWSLSEEIVQRQILILMTKTLARWQFILGKWLGIVVLDLLLLCGAGLGIYGMSCYLASLPERMPDDHARIRSEVLIARHVSRAEVPDFTKHAALEFERRKEEGDYAERVVLDPEEEKKKLRQLIEATWRNLMPRDYRTFEFKNLRCQRAPDHFLQLRFNAEVHNPPPTEAFTAVWHFGDRTRQTAEYTHVGRYTVERVHSVPVPSDALTPEGTLIATCQNIDPANHPTVLNFGAERTLEVLFPVGTFGGNLLRTLTLLMCRLMFLAAVAVLATSIFSFPIACVCTLAFYGFLALRDFIMDAFSYMTDEDWTGTLFRGIGWAVQGLYMLVPDFRRYNAVELFVDGRNVTLLWVIDGVVRLGLATLLVGGVACLLFYRREVSEVSV